MLNDYVSFLGSEKITTLKDGRQVSGVSRVLKSKNRSYEAIVFMQGRPILDSEINLVQSLYLQKLLDFSATLVKSGWTHITPAGIASNSPTKAVFNAFDYIFNGQLVRFDDGTGRCEIQMAPAIGQPYRTDYIVSYLYREEIAAPGEGTRLREQVKLYGNLNGGNVASDILDPALPTPLPTTHRVQLSYRNVSCVENNFLNLPVLDTLGRITEGYTFALDAAQGIYRAGDGTSQAAEDLGTADGYVYLVPLFRVNREQNDQTIQADRVIPVVPKFSLRISPSPTEFYVQPNLAIGLEKSNVQAAFEDIYDGHNDLLDFLIDCYTSTNSKLKAIANSLVPNGIVPDYNPGNGDPTDYEIMGMYFDYQSNNIGTLNFYYDGTIIYQDIPYLYSNSEWKIEVKIKLKTESTWSLLGLTADNVSVAGLLKPSQFVYITDKSLRIRLPAPGEYDIKTRITNSINGKTYLALCSAGTTPAYAIIDVNDDAILEFGFQKTPTDIVDIGAGFIPARLAALNKTVVNYNGSGGNASVSEWIVNENDFYGQKRIEASYIDNEFPAYHDSQVYQPYVLTSNHKNKIEFGAAATGNPGDSGYVARSNYQPSMIGNDRGKVDAAYHLIDSPDKQRQITVIAVLSNGQRYRKKLIGAIKTPARAQPAAGGTIGSYVPSDASSVPSGGTAIQPVNGVVVANPPAGGFPIDPQLRMQIGTVHSIGADFAVLARFDPVSRNVTLNLTRYGFVKFDTASLASDPHTLEGHVFTREELYLAFIDSYKRMAGNNNLSGKQLEQATWDGSFRTLGSDTGIGNGFVVKEITWDFGDGFTATNTAADKVLSINHRYARRPGIVIDPEKAYYEYQPTATIGLKRDTGSNTEDGPMIYVKPAFILGNKIIRIDAYTAQF